MLDRAASASPDAIALIYGDQRYTYAELRTYSHALASGLHARGVMHADRVAIWLPNVPLWIGLMFACARLGAQVVAVNTRFKSSELGDILGRSGAKMLVYWPGFRGIDFTGIFEGLAQADASDLHHVIAYSEGEATPERVRGLPVTASEDLLRSMGDAPWAGRADDGCVMYTTSGTTSLPKLVLHTQQSIVYHAQNTAQVLGYNAPGTVIQVVTPLSGVSGFGMPFTAIAAQRPFVLMPAFDARLSLDLIRQHRVTHIHANHEIIRRWFDSVTANDDLTSLKMINCGSGMAAAIERASQFGVAVQSIYGSSELQARFSRQSRDFAPERQLEAGGFPLSPQAQVRAVDIESGRILPQGEKGELQMRAPSQMQAYFGDAQATARGLTDDGFVRTGDCGYTRDDGSFVFEARMGDVLKLSGFMVSPAEIESFVLKYPGIEQCQVVGTETSQGLRAIAFVRGAAAIDEAALLRHCRGQMANYKVPARVIQLDAFPVTAGANAPKVQKARLREMAAALARE